LLKPAYSGIIIVWYARGMMPFMWVPFAPADPAFMMAFVTALVALPAPKPEG
jgi:hypothetical protein